jgi:hypothetical protein
MKKTLLVALAGLLLSTGLAPAQFVRVAPPPPPVERRPPPPDVRFVWIPGYHRWDGHAYHWTAGRWVMPPRPHAVWIDGHWVPRQGGYQWVPGRWR